MAAATEFTVVSAEEAAEAKRIENEGKDFEDHMADNEEALDDANEIASLISNSSSNLDELDDDELAAELAALEGPQKRVAIESDTEKQINSMPQVPTNSIVVQQNQNQKNSESPSQERVLLTT